MKMNNGTSRILLRYLTTAIFCTCQSNRVKKVQRKVQITFKLKISIMVYVWPLVILCQIIDTIVFFRKLRVGC